MLTLKRVYGAAVPPNVLPCTLLSLPHSDIAQFQDELVTDLLLAPHFRDFPPSHGFRCLFWKWIVNTLEACNEARIVWPFLLSADVIVKVVIRKWTRGSMKHVWIYFLPSQCLYNARPCSYSTGLRLLLALLLLRYDPLHLPIVLTSGR